MLDETTHNFGGIVSDHGFRLFNILVISFKPRIPLMNATMGYTIITINLVHPLKQVLPTLQQNLMLPLFSMLTLKSMTHIVTSQPITPLAMHQLSYFLQEEEM